MGRKSREKRERRSEPIIQKASTYPYRPELKGAAEFFDNLGQLAGFVGISAAYMGILSILLFIIVGIT
jgi:hypothetical protein